ncbi:MAG TPA: class I SAM-dependent methyltransferase, partial [Solirubrobacteraceae bacterium]|nr:class I SAM-dependent methyltransferase [Solirubrobacteraceae bacterium]
MEIFEDSAWQMSRGERAALEGVLAQRRPELAIEVGGVPGSLARIARHTAEVHSLGAPAAAAAVPGVAFHPGDPDELLPALLADLAAAGRNVDFVLLEGEAGIARHLLALLDSPALARSAVLVAGTTAPGVRREVDSVRFSAWPKVALFEADFVPGHMLAGDPGHGFGGGLGLVLVDSARLRYGTGSVVDERCLPTAALFAEVRDYVLARGPGARYGGSPIDPGQARVIARLERELRAAEHEVRRLRSVARHHEELWRSLM